MSDGNAGMMSWWDENYVIGPISLANNNHYGTYCEAAAMFMQHCAKFLQFLEFVRGSKENLYRTLQDPPTLTELAVLALYAKTTSHPYMCLIHGHDINMLDLGPLHTKVEWDMERTIENHLINLGPHTTFVTEESSGNILV